ncbi:glycoside hydrolase family 88/105 protein [Dysgonomonas termitidis]|uniref:Glycoside hydrolase family 105 protein n=2 Tax=Dysgonomonas termitidis TaxID=1516126 RepID=A0ABV9KRW0_9BACT
MADSEMRRNPEAWMIDFSKTPGWNYCHGLEMQSILQVWKRTGSSRYYDYVYEYADMMINDEGKIKTYKPEEYNIDRINTGKILFPLLEKTREERFCKALTLLRSQMNTHPRTTNGSFWHKKIYQHQVWLDGLYMACPFLVQYAVQFDEPALFDDVALQIIDVHRHMYDKKTGLYYHGWDESRQQRWADPRTGLSPNFWSRSIGWYMMSVVDALDFIPKDHKQRQEIISILKNLSQSLEKFRDKETGMWYQVTNQLGREGNYLESTGSIMFIYSWIKGAQKGYLDNGYLQKGIDAYDKYIERFIRKDAGGELSVTDCCAVSGLGGEKVYRDGSFEYYISEPIRDNDPKAVSPFIMASILLDR